MDGGIALRISFNFPTGLWEVAMIERLLAKVRAAGVQPQQLVMEVTESAAMGNPAETERILELLQDAGMPLAIDDFGTGYSSLSRLNHLPAETLKIDRSFVRDLPHDAPSVALTETIVRLARGVGMEPLAEGRPRPSGASWSSTAAISARDSCSAGRCRPPRSSGFGISGTARRPER
jgi:EAL domain-containing protein (putative c-di-GMP-specific phosphodiesterase class I)